MKKKKQVSLSLSPFLSPMADLKLISLSRPFCSVVGNCRRRRVWPVFMCFVLKERKEGKRLVFIPLVFSVPPSLSLLSYLSSLLSLSQNGKRRSKPISPVGAVSNTIVS